MRKIFLILIFTIISFSSGASVNDFSALSGEDKFGGLSFYSNKYETPDKTRYDIFNHPRNFPKEEFRVSFDLEFVGFGSIGYLFTCKNKNTDQFNLKTTYKKIQNCYEFTLHLRFAGKKLRLNIPADYLGYNTWRRCSFGILPREGKAVLRVGEYSTSADFNPEYICSQQEKVRYVFGRCDDNVDIMEFSIRDVVLNEDGKTHHFPLNEISGNIVHSSRGRAVGTVFRPNWIHNQHQEWTLCGEFPETEIASVFYDDSTDCILFYTSSCLRQFQMPDGGWGVQRHDFENPFRIREGGGFNYLFNQETADCLMFNNTAPGEPSSVPAIYNYKKNTIEYPTGKLRTSTKNHHNTVFSDKAFEHYWQIGGMGNFQYHNELYEASSQNFTWKIVKFSGDTICPREFMSVASIYEGNQESVFLFGGYGNQTGPKLDGADFMFDLYQLDLKKRSIKRLAEFEDFPEDRVPSRDMIMGEDGHSFYVLLYPHFLQKSDAQLYKFDWLAGTWTSLGKNIPFNAYKQSSQVHLFEDKDLGYMIAVIQEFKDATQSMVRLYRIRVPILSDVSMEVPAGPLSSTWIWWLLILLFLAIGISGAVILILRKKKHREEILAVPSAKPVKTEAVIEEETSVPEQKVNKNFIYILGDFSVFDRNGRDITYMFSSKIRQLFLLVFLNTERESSQGVSSDEISANLWPEKELSKSSNVRGVTMANLRNVLTELDGVQIVNRQGKWFVEMDYQVCNCDFHAVCNPEVDLYKVSSYDDVRPYVHYLRRGLLLKSEEWDWIDLFKSEYEERILTLYSSVMKNAYKKAEYMISYRVSQVLLSIDMLNEDLMKIEINSLLKMGNPDKARVKFRMFSINYYEAYNKNLLFEDYID